MSQGFMCRVKELGIADLYAIYGQLSDAIHGQPWVGPAVRINSSLDLKTRKLIENITKDLNINIELFTS